MDLKDIDSKLFTIGKAILGYDILIPINVKEEYERWKKDKSYSPQLKYKPFDAQPFIEELQSLDIPTDSPAGNMLENMRVYLLNYAQELLNIGSDSFDLLALFCELDDELVNQAKTILEKQIPQEEGEEKKKDISAKELGETLKEISLRYGFDNWKIVIDPNAASTVDMNQSRQQITIRSDLMISTERVNKLIIHEIETHLLRAENGRCQPFTILMLGLPHYLTTEEGLAGYNERSQGINSPQTIRAYALRTIATAVAHNKGFNDVFDVIRPFYTDEENADEDAFRTALRVKRGLGDTSKPGGFLKDHSYLKGMILIERFVKEGGNIKDLYAGKISIEDLHLLDKGVIKPAKILPTFLR